MRPISTRAPEDLVSVGSVKGLMEVVAEFVIWEVSCLKTTPDQVRTRFWLRFKVVDKCSKSAADSVANDRVSDLSTDRVRHVHRTTLRRANHETDSQWTTLTSSRGCREERELPAGADPTGHPN
jgi:hypothetical protein